jgi:transcriptional regulator with XRE-family HTH domain
MFGLTQQQFADCIGVTYQQAHKYEKGLNRISAARLLEICKALGNWSVAEALTGIGGPPPAVDIGMRQRVELASLFAKLDPRRGGAVLRLVRSLVEEASTGIDL